MRQHNFRLVASLVGVLSFVAFAPTAHALTLSYGGRISEADGSVVAGPIDLEVKFYRDAQGGSAIETVPQIFQALPLKDGVFEVSLELDAVDFQRLFGGEAVVWIEATDLTRGEVYPRQRLHSVPLAGRVPVESKQLAFGADGKLGFAVAPEAGKYLLANGDGSLSWGTPTSSGDMGRSTYDANQDGAADNAEKLGGKTVTYLTDADHHTDGLTNKVFSVSEKSKLASVEPGAQAVTPARVAAAGAVMDVDFTSNGLMTRTADGVYTTTPDRTGDWDQAFTLRGQWSGGATGLDAAAGRESLELGTAATRDVGALAGNLVEIGIGGKLPAVDASLLTNLPWHAATFTTVVLKDADGDHFAQLKAPAEMAADTTYTLPAAPTAGKYLRTDANGGLSWEEPTGAGDMAKAVYDVGADGKADRANDSDKLGGQVSSYFTNAANLTGSVPDARLSANVSLLGASISSSEVSDLDASKLTGTIQDARLSANVSLLGASISSSEIVDLDAAKLSGTVADARLSANVSLLGSSISSSEIADATIAATDLADGAVTNAKIVAVDGGKISSGVVAVANGGTGASLAASGGAGQYLKQTSAGAPVTVGSISAADYPTMGGASSGSAGMKGAVPQPAAGDQAKFLRGDGTWAASSGSGISCSVYSIGPFALNAGSGSSNVSLFCPSGKLTGYGFRWSEFSGACTTNVIINSANLHYQVYPNPSDDRHALFAYANATGAAACVTLYGTCCQ